MKKGFTLIELLIVVAIIAILAAIAVPNFLEAQVRAKVSRVKNDQRSLATALETYYVDNNTYPLAAGSSSGTTTVTMLKNRGYVATATVPTGTAVAGRNEAGFTVAPKPAVPGLTSGVPSFFSLTTPISYISSYFTDPFSQGARDTFVYYPDGPCWILVSYGPDADQPSGATATTAYSDLIGDLATDFYLASGTETFTATAFFCEDLTGSRQNVLVGTAVDGTTVKQSYTYDPTNGTTSPGDVYRIKD